MLERQRSKKEQKREDAKRKEKTWPKIQRERAILFGVSECVAELDRQMMCICVGVRRKTKHCVEEGRTLKAKISVQLSCPIHVQNKKEKSHRIFRRISHLYFVHIFIYSYSHFSRAVN